MNANGFDELTGTSFHECLVANGYSLGPLNDSAAVIAKIRGLPNDHQLVLADMILGKSIKASSRALHLSTRTVERIRKSNLETMGVTSIPALAVLIDRALSVRPLEDSYR